MISVCNSPQCSGGVGADQANQTALQVAGVNAQYFLKKGFQVNLPEPFLFTQKHQQKFILYFYFYSTAGAANIREQSQQYCIGLLTLQLPFSQHLKCSRTFSGL